MDLATLLELQARAAWEGEVTPHLQFRKLELRWGLPMSISALEEGAQVTGLLVTPWSDRVRVMPSVLKLQTVSRMRNQGCKKHRGRKRYRGDKLYLTLLKSLAL